MSKRKISEAPVIEVPAVPEPWSKLAFVDKKAGTEMLLSVGVFGITPRSFDRWTELPTLRGGDGRCLYRPADVMRVAIERMRPVAGFNRAA